jgi:endo-1,4-beta-xylanase
LKLSLKEFAAPQGIHIGSLIHIEHLQNDPNYERRLLEQFDMVVINGFGRTYRAPGVFDFSATDPEVDFAAANNLRIRAQPIIYHAATPRWINDGDWTPEEAREILQEYVQGIVGHYRGRVDVWIVANEIMDDEGELRPNIWLRTIGPEYVNLIFRWAREADPDAVLLYNDYHLERPGPKSEAVFRMVRKMRNNGVPIDGVGFQLHLELGSAPNLAALQSQMQRFSRLGLFVDVTEMDVRLRSPFTEDRLGAQADVYAVVMQACLNVRRCKNFTMWGFTDEHSWVDREFPGYGAAHIFDYYYNPKPAFDALIKVLRQN